MQDVLIGQLAQTDDAGSQVQMIALKAIEASGLV